MYDDRTFVIDSMIVMQRICERPENDTKALPVRGLVGSSIEA
jgi:hypothetical protein